jgi:hypothetical protein
MRIEQTKTTVQTVGDIVSVETDRLVIETPDPEPAPLVVNMTFADAPSFKASQDQLRRNFGTATPVATARAAMEGKPQPGPWPHADEQVHFKATPGESIPLRYAAMEPRRPNREIPLWAFARQFFVNEFSVLDPRRADAIADHFMEKYKAEWRDGKESGR